MNLSSMSTITNISPCDRAGLTSGDQAGGDITHDILVWTRGPKPVLLWLLGEFDLAELLSLIERSAFLPGPQHSFPEYIYI